MNFDTIRKNLRGNIVPVPGHFNADLTLDHQAYRDHVAFLRENGVSCFYMAQSASEFDYMTIEERVSVTRTVATCIVPGDILIAQAVGGQWIDEQIEEGKRLIDAGAHAVVIAPRAIKEGNKFFSSFYSRASYVPSRHDVYYHDYMLRLTDALRSPVIYHDKPFKSGKGPSMAMLENILSLEGVVGLKEHVPDPVTLQRIYGTFGSRLACFDGFGKTMQFWSLQWGASGRHTCWSWFDPRGDKRFLDAVQLGDMSSAAAQVLTDYPVAEGICQTGFQGYKYLMQLMGLPGGPCRIPGEALTPSDQRLLKEALVRVGLTS